MIALSDTGIVGVSLLVMLVVPVVVFIRDAWRGKP